MVSPSFLHQGHLNCVTFLINFGVNLWDLDIDLHSAKVHLNLIWIDFVDMSNQKDIMKLFIHSGSRCNYVKFICHPDPGHHNLDHETGSGSCTNQQPTAEKTSWRSYFCGPIDLNLFAGSRRDQQPRRHLEVPGCRWGSTGGHQPKAGKVIAGDDDNNSEMFLTTLMFASNLFTEIIHT